MIPFCMLSVNSFNALVTFPLVISRVNLLEISATVDGVFDDPKSFGIVFPHEVNPGFPLMFISPYVVHNVFKCSLDFDF